MNTSKIKRENVSWKKFAAGILLTIALVLLATVMMAPRADAAPTCMGNAGACGVEGAPPPTIELDGEDALCAGSAGIAGAGTYISGGTSWAVFVMTAAG